MNKVTLPITSRFEPKVNKASTPLYEYNFEVCSKTGRIFTEYLSTNPIIEYKYNWLTCFEPENHLDELNKIIFEEYHLKKDLVIYGYSFKDDTLLERIKKVSFKKKLNFRIKSSLELGLPVKGACLNELINFTNKTNIQNIAEENGKCDILIMRHVIEHFWDLEKKLQAIKYLLKDNGKIIFEVPDSEYGFKNKLSTIIWEEHFSYFTINSLKTTLISNSFKINNSLRYKNKLEDSLVIFSSPCEKISLPKKESSSIFKENKKILERFFNDIYEKKIILNKFFESIKSNKILLFGAGHHASTFVNFNQCERFIDFVIDDNIHKQNKLLSGTRLMIVKKNILKNFDNPHIFLTTNPENYLPIKEMILELNPSSKVFSIFSI